MYMYDMLAGQATLMTVSKYPICFFGGMYSQNYFGSNKKGKSSDNRYIYEKPIQNEP